MTQEPADKERKILDPVERASEVLFGLIMVLSFTGSISVATGGREEIRTILVGAIGCNLAWGLVDAVMYVLQSLIERNRGLLVLKAVRRTPDSEVARGLIADALPDALVPLMRPADLEHLRGEIARLPEPPASARITWTDLRGAAGVFLLVFLSTFPAVIPFLFIHGPTRALRVSNAVAIVLLYIAGHRIGSYSGLGAVRSGMATVAIGVVLVAITVALGG
jgi:hypothetical protein